MHPDSTPTRLDEKKKATGCGGIGCGALALVVVGFAIWGALASGGTGTSTSGLGSSRSTTGGSTQRSTGSDAAYPAFVAAKAQTMSASLTRTSALMAAPTLTVDWKIAVAAEIATWTLTRDEVAGRTPPAAYASAHRAFLAGLNHIVASGDLLARGVDTGDASLITAATAEMDSGNAALAEATRRVNAVSAS